MYFCRFFNLQFWNYRRLLTNTALSLIVHDIFSHKYAVQLLTSSMIHLI